MASNILQPPGCLLIQAEELKWTTTETCREFFLEMVLDRGASGKPSNDKDLKPAKDATVKRVNMGRDTSGSIQNMPEGRSFLVRVVGKLQVGKEVYSPWTRAITLSPKTRDKDLGNLDPMNMPRSLPLLNEGPTKLVLEVLSAVKFYWGGIHGFSDRAKFVLTLNRPSTLTRHELQQLPLRVSCLSFDVRRTG